MAAVDLDEAAEVVEVSILLVGAVRCSILRTIIANKRNKKLFS